MRSFTTFTFAAFLTSAMFFMAGCGSETEPAADVTKTTEAEPEPVKKLAAGDMAPAWVGTDLVEETAIEFPDVLDGKPAVLVFWATWCPYCKAFMPYTEAIQADYADAGVKIITFNAKERGQGNPWAYVMSLDFPIIAIADADPIAEQYGVEFIPGLMVVNGDGKVIYRRGWTELPAGQKVAEFWDGEVRAALDREVEQMRLAEAG